MDNSILVRRSR